MPLTALDQQRLREALALAEGSIGLSEPNPRVGCVLGRADGSVLGRGCTQEAGGPHAEVMALREARSAGAELRGATAWVTLEPCAHHGRTPPCCDALVDAGIGRVVVAIGDPFPQVAGAGLARLRAAGISVDLAAGEIATAARELNIGFFSRMERGRPWVRLKAAMTLDGLTALADGASQWITGPEARADGHAWRRRAGAVLTGVGTVVADDPRLDVRLVPTRVQPLRVVLDPRWRTPPASRILAEPGRCLVLGTATPAEALRAAGAELQQRPAAADGGLDLADVLAQLATRQVNELHVEAGARLNGAWLRSGLVDELLVYVAPRLAGPGRPLALLPALARLSDAMPWQFTEVRPLGPDLLLRLRPAELSKSFTSGPPHE
jgi:diaminohydroxyphosphoribosylaminopyrimidine deaminase/5-amino-6-(5-phosphoribosylamino)uracil reductase